MVSDVVRGLSTEERLVFFLSRPLLSIDTIGLCNEILNKGIDQDIFVKKADITRTSPFIYRNLKLLENVSQDLENRFKIRYLGSMRRNILLMEEIKRIISVLRCKGIDTIPLKGPVASELIFGDIALYSGSDIDILIKPSDIQLTKRILIDMGYKECPGFFEKDYLKTSYHLPPYMKNGFYVEVHWNLTMRYFSSDPEFWWEGIEERGEKGERFLCLEPERYLLYTVFRLFSHAFYPLKFHILVAGLVLLYRERIDWNRLSHISRLIGMDRLLGFTLNMTKDFFEIKIPFEYEDSFVERHIRHIILRTLFEEAPVLTRKMIVYSYLNDAPGGYISTLFRRLIPSPSEIRSRYGIETDSKSLLRYYILNPFYLFFGKKIDN